MKSDDITERLSVLNCQHIFPFSLIWPRVQAPQKTNSNIISEKHNYVPYMHDQLILAFERLKGTNGILIKYFVTTFLDDPDGKAVMLLTKKFDCEPIIYFLDEVILYLLQGLSVEFNFLLLNRDWKLHAFWMLLSLFPIPWQTVVVGAVVKKGGSMDQLVHTLMYPVYGGGPWTRGPCFVLSTISDHLCWQKKAFFR